MPPLSTGQYTITATDNYGNVGSAIFTASQQTVYYPNLSVPPTSGLVGQTVSMLATGFKANSVVTNKIGTTTLPSFTTDSSGTLTGSFAVPSLSSGTYTIQSTDDNNSATFQITGQPACIPPSSGDWILTSSCTLSSCNRTGKRDS